MARETGPRWAIGRLLKERIGTRPIAEVAAEAGIGRTTLYNWLASTYPPAGALARLRPVLGITHEELEKALLEDEQTTLSELQARLLAGEAEEAELAAEAQGHRDREDLPGSGQ